MNSHDIAMMYLVVRRFGTCGKYWPALDRLVKDMLKTPEIYSRVRDDYDSLVSDIDPKYSET